MYYVSRFHVPAEADKWWFIVWELRLTGAGKRHQFVKKITDPTNQYEKGDTMILQSKNIHNEYNIFKEIFKGLNV